MRASASAQEEKDTLFLPHLYRCGVGADGCCPAAVRRGVRGGVARRHRRILRLSEARSVRALPCPTCHVGVGAQSKPAAPRSTGTPAGRRTSSLGSPAPGGGPISWLGVSGSTHSSSRKSSSLPWAVAGAPPDAAACAGSLAPSACSSARSCSSDASCRSEGLRCAAAHSAFSSDSAAALSGSGAMDAAARDTLKVEEHAVRSACDGGARALVRQRTDKLYVRSSHEGLTKEATRKRNGDYNPIVRAFSAASTAWIRMSELCASS